MNKSSAIAQMVAQVEFSLSSEVDLSETRCFSVISKNITMNDNNIGVT